MPADHEALEVLNRHRRIWKQKPVLRRIYQEEFFSRQLAQRKPGGISIEVGGGPGFFKEVLPEVVSTDPFAESNPERAAAKKAFDGNQAIPYLLFGSRNRAKTMALVPRLAIATIEQFCLFAYLLSFGFKP